MSLYIKQKAAQKQPFVVMVSQWTIVYIFSRKDAKELKVLASTINTTLVFSCFYDILIRSNELSVFKIIETTITLFVVFISQEFFVE